MVTSLPLYPAVQNNLRNSRNIWNLLFEQTKIGDLCDVLICNDDAKIWAHSCILAAFSCNLSQLFINRRRNGESWSCQNPIEIHMKDIGGTSLNCRKCTSDIIRYMYTGQIELNLKHSRHVSVLGEYFGNDELLGICNQFKHDRFKFKRNVETKRPNKFVIVLNEDKNLTQSTKNWPGGVNNCSTCGFVTSDNNLMETHSKAFHSNYYRCLYCDFKHKNVLNLVEHSPKCYKSEQNVLCSICLFRGDNLIQLISHLEIHKHDKPFQCDECKKLFNRRSLWLKHLKAHTIKKGYECSGCELKFNKENDRAKHFKLVHGPKNHVCSQCGFAAAFASILEKHVLKHRKISYHCEHCDFLTSSETMLIRHRVKHKASKSAKVAEVVTCSLCHMKFTLRKNLIRHMKIHCKEKSKCQYCNYETWRSDKFKEHMMNKHHEMRSVRNGSCRDSDCKNEPMVGVDNANVDGTKEGFKVEGQYKRNNRLMMNDEGDISIVNTDRRNAMPLTLRNIGNLTGSITLDERTGIVTMSNINSGSVFLNETTGELTYVNLEKDSSVDNFNVPCISDLVSEMTKLDEFTGEIVKVLPSAEDSSTVSMIEQEVDAFDMDLNDDSLDGFDDFDEVLFDDIDLNATLPSEPGREMLRLDESTGLLTLDEELSHSGRVQEMWSTSYGSRLKNGSSINDDDAYRLLLDEVTGVLHD